MGKLGYICRCIVHMDYGALFETVGECHQKSGKNRVWLFADVVKCGFKFGAGYKDYSLLEFYNMTDTQRATFVTRGVNNTIVRRLNNPEYYHLLDNKNEFYQLFDSDLHRGWLHFSKVSKEEFLSFMQNRDQIIAKPSDLCCGQGVEKLKVADFASLDALYDHLKATGADLIEDVVVQHPDMAKIFPGSVNTIRMYTVRPNDNEPAHVIYACIRMGNSDRPVDNINAGGMYAVVNLETGKIAGPACDKDFHVFERHPRSGTELPGYQIPLWDQVMALCERAATEIPGMGYVGWDVAITEDGPLFIEANNLPGHDAFPQMPSQAPDHIGFKPQFEKYLGKL